jgi:hypothetical protein
MAKPCTPHLIAQRVQLFKIKTANVRGQGVRPLAFLWGFQRGYSLWKENTPFAPAARRRHIPAPLGARKPTLFGPAKEKRAMYEYFHVKAPANASILGGFSLDPEYRNIIDRAAEEGWRYVGFLPVSQSVNGAILEYDLIFEQEKK